MGSALKKIKAQQGIFGGRSGRDSYFWSGIKEAFSEQEWARDSQEDLVRVFLSGQFFFFITMKCYLSKLSNKNMLESM